VPATVDAESAIESTTTLEVRVLGTLRVEGLTERFPQRKCPELVTYLALHRHGVEADTLMEALWPEQPPEYRRLNILTSRARVTLGKAPDGDLYVPHIRGGIYKVSPQLGCDLERFDRLVRVADRASPADAVEHLRAALELVEGPPFNGAGDAYNWAHTEGIITHAIVAIDNAAHRLAQHALDDDPALASWAARKGLTATSACEECYRNLMRAAIAQDDHTALEATFNELTAVIDADDGPDATSLLDPETVTLYEDHTRNRRRHAG
jgi:DNA-binding SARP family transcriptional activator